ncbi:nucleotide exchange factor GrpE [Nonomuraea sp. NPDC050556]|uniref:nucleotide exchange factor GrpE n=1 Tax=Nonomuraea sp. NPDC050556 TaxID=3364369 RepID=UPI00379D4007
MSNGFDEEPVIRDNRKIDPETGEARKSAPEPEQQEAPEAGLLAERTADLQRLQAEYTNYRRRVERDRIAVREQSVASALVELLPVLDDIGRARDHGEVTGGFAKVAESLEAAVTKLGLTSYGQKGDPFDPTIHEALMHSYSPDVTEPTCIDVLQPGYRIGERVLRPARVAVAEPEDAPSSDDND